MTEAFVDRWSGLSRVIDGNTSAMALADLIRTALGFLVFGVDVWSQP